MLIKIKYPVVALLVHWFVTGALPSLSCIMAPKRKLKPKGMSNTKHFSN